MIVKLLNITQTLINSAGQLIVKVIGSRTAYTAVDVGPYGIDARPIKNTTAAYLPTQIDGDEIIIGYLVSNKKAAEGEVRFFSTDTDGNEKFYTWLRSDGTYSIGGENNNAVKFNELKTEFNALKADHNTLVQKWNAFCTAYIPGSPILTGSPGTLAGSTVSANTSNIDNAKNDKIKTI